MSRGLVLLAALGLTVAGCSAAAAGPEPAGPNPSPIAKMVCAPKTQVEIAEALGETIEKVSPPTWVGHLYACNYDFTHGLIRLSVKELSSESETTAYFAAMGAQMGRRQVLYGLGQGALLTRDGSVIARKDWKVLVVDTSRLPASFGAHQRGSGTPGETVAFTIMECWDGD